MHALVLSLARLMATLGGVVLSALVLLTCVSILGRSMNGLLHGDLMQGIAPGLATALLDLGVGPVQGDFELVEAGMAFTTFAFLPLCQITGAHAAVDVFTAAMSDRKQRFLRWMAEVAFAFVLVLIAVQLFGGMQTKLRAGQTTFLLAFPVWWAYAASLTGAAVAALVSVYLAIMRTVEMLTGRAILPGEMGAEH